MARFLGNWTEHDMGACRDDDWVNFWEGKDPKIRQIQVKQPSEMNIPGFT